MGLLQRVGYESSSRWAVLLIDMQPTFVDTVAAAERQELIECQQDMLARCAHERVPVVVVEYKDEGKTIPRLQKYLTGSNVLGKVVKPHDGAFTRTSLDRLLRRNGVTCVFTAGVNASGCVLQTAEEAKKRGYEVAAAFDVMADRQTARDKSKGMYLYRHLGLYKPRAEEVLDILENRYLLA